MLSPDKLDERQTMYVFGSAGSGKSYFVSAYCSEYYKVFKFPIYLISEQDTDKAFDSKEYIKRLNICDMVENPLDWKEFIVEPCLIIFDDIDSISSKKLSNAVEMLRDQLLKNARKYRVSVISRSQKYLYENYLGLDKVAMEKIKQSKSRWCAYVKSYPSYLEEA